MSKIKKILLGVLLTVLTLLVLANSFLLYRLWVTRPPLVINLMGQTYYKADDVAYIRADIAEPDPQLVKDKTLKTYSPDDIRNEMNEAIKNRDENNAESDTAN